MTFKLFQKFALIELFKKY